MLRAMNITTTRRKELAEKLGKSDAYLYQCMAGIRAMGPADAVQIERETDGELRRWHLRPKDWHLIWPELIGTEGAPQPSAQVAA